MVDWSKLVRKHQQDALEGEEVLTTLLFSRSGTTSLRFADGSTLTLDAGVFQPFGRFEELVAETAPV